METWELCIDLGKYGKAEEYQKKALSMVKRIGHKIGDKQGEARVM